MLDSIQPPQHYEPAPAGEQPRRKPKSRFRLWVTLVMLLLLAAGIFVGSRLVIFAQRVFEGKSVTFSLRQLFLAGDKTLIGEPEGMIRILLLGIGGEGHEGPNLTDTMILLTIQLPKSGNDRPKIGFLSIPRDLAVYIPGYDYRKINSAYAYGETGGQKNGPKLALKTVEQVLGVAIPYYGVVDFQGFKKIIDDLGGVTIDVERTFTDPLFPDEKTGYLPPVTFEKGLQKMDGTRALEYVRSRHGNNEEGTDFARSRRQEKLLQAVKNKATGLKVVTNLGLLNRLLNDLSQHLRTNLSPYELQHLYNLAKNIPSENISALAIDHEGALVCDQTDADTGAYLLVPCQGLGNYEAIRNLLLNEFLLSELRREQPSIEIQNASRIANLGQRTQNFINLPFLKFTLSNFKAQAVYQESVLYDNTSGAKPETLNYLKAKLGIRLAQSPFPFPAATPSSDFVIVVTEELAARL